MQVSTPDTRYLSSWCCKITTTFKISCISIIQIIKYILIRPRNGKSRNPRAIVISPTRELCLQIHRYALLLFLVVPLLNVEWNGLTNHYGVRMYVCGRFMISLPPSFWFYSLPPPQTNICQELIEVHWVPLTTSNLIHKNMPIINGTRCNRTF